MSYQIVVRSGAKQYQSWRFFSFKNLDEIEQKLDFVHANYIPRPADPFDKTQFLHSGVAVIQDEDVTVIVYIAQPNTNVKLSHFDTWSSWQSWSYVKFVV